MRLLITFISAITLTASAFACGPYFPNAYFAFGDELRVVEMPEASFFYELCRILHVTPPEEPYYHEPGMEWDHTLAADIATLTVALTHAGRSSDDIATLVNLYRAYREATRNNVADTAIESNLEDVPAEFAHYAKAAAAYNAENFDGAEAQWSALLALPESDRQYRSVWAAYMVGKSQLRRDAPQAAASFEKAIELAHNGYPDPLNLAGQSLGWLGYIALEQGDIVTAVHRYAEQFALGDAAQHSARLSLDMACKSAIGAKDALTALAQDGTARAVMTAWVVSHPATQQAAMEWLNVLDEPGLQVDHADLLAWTAYDHGNFDAAKKWLAQPTADTAVADWVRAKLALRDGDLAAAETSLRASIARAQTAPHFIFEPDASEYGYPATVPLTHIAQRELGVLLLGQNRYADALDQYMRAGHWMDAAYIAERVLTVDELVAYVDNNAANPEFAVGNDEFYFEDGVFGMEGENATVSPNRMDALRYLLSRRLARASRWEEVIRYVPQGLLPTAKELASALQNGGAGKPPATETGLLEWFLGARPRVVVDRERAAALFHAGELTREHGLRLLGTEVSPDWAVFYGDFALRGADEGRLAVPRNFGTYETLPEATKRVLQASEDEARRAREHLPRPYKRFHYRYVAADLMWQCAALLPDDDVETMRALWTGGMYIQLRDPQDANRFYRSLVWRNPNMPYAQQADRRRWFPAEPPE